MDLMSVLTAVTHPGVDPEVPDARDPESAAAFTELLATLVAAPGVPALAGAVGAPVAPAAGATSGGAAEALMRSEEHTSELQSLMRISYAVFCLTKKKIY